MHWRRKVGIGLVFVCMPAVAPLWGMLIGIETHTMIRLQTLPFLLGLLLTLASNMPPQTEEE